MEGYPAHPSDFSVRTSFSHSSPNLSEYNHRSCSCRELKTWALGETNAVLRNWWSTLQQGSTEVPQRFHRGSWFFVINSPQATISLVNVDSLVSAGRVPTAFPRINRDTNIRTDEPLCTIAVPYTLQSALDVRLLQIPYTCMCAIRYITLGTCRMVPIKWPVWLITPFMPTQGMKTVPQSGFWHACNNVYPRSPSFYFLSVCSRTLTNTKYLTQTCNMMMMTTDTETLISLDTVDRMRDSVTQRRQCWEKTSWSV